ncbi:8607_t:CDS:10 [Ambispora leptoticha]|uniref:8607_t:CDS:1 n=1 Tax=Ambispora leptoticha TaxID=144679 RepID=A0A9N8ZJV5_9GLOM|nr:8607_t:CDS:10 [Ambispora leptoticha]
MVYQGYNYECLIDQLKDQSFFGAPNTLIFVAPDVDALCAYKMLELILNEEYICHQCVAISSEEDLRKWEDRVNKDSVYKTIILINCGGAFDIGGIFKITSKDHLKIFVLDSHRPYNCRTLFHYDQVIVLDEDHYKDTLEKLYDSYARLMDLNEKSRDLERQESEYVEERRGNKRQRIETRASTSKKAKADTDDEKQKLKKELANYEQSPPYYSKSVARLVYTMSLKISKASLEDHPSTKNLLWWAIIGLASQYINSLITEEAYKEEYTYYLEVLKLIKHEDMKPMYMVAPANGSDNNIRREQNWRSYLTEMGISLNQSRQEFIAVRTEIGPKLHEKLAKFAESHKVKDLEFPSFARTYGFHTTLTACDAAYALNALIDTFTEHAESVGCQIDSADKASSKLEKDSWWNFYSASDSVDDITSAIKLSKNIQQFIVERCNEIIQKRNAIKKEGRIHFVVLGSGGAQDLLSHPRILRRFANFLASAYKEKSTKDKKIAMIVVVPILDNTCYLVIGVMAGQIKNPLPTLFIQTIATLPETIANDLRFPSFSKDVFVIPQKDYAVFKEKLILIDAQAAN